MMQQIRIAMDWTANAMHAGIQLAYEKKWYEAQGVQLEFIYPSMGINSISTVELLWKNKTDLAIAPPEMLINSHITGRKNIISIATLLQENTSCIAAKPNFSKVEELRNRKYASLSIPFESNIIHHFLGEGTFRQIGPSKKEIYNTLYNGKVDFVWMFKTIEGVESEIKKNPLTYFSLEGAGIPYLHCPLLLTNTDFAETNFTALKNFLSVTAKAYEWIVENPEEAYLFFENSEREMIKSYPYWRRTLEETIPYFVNQHGQWGVMSDIRWKKYFDWMKKVNSFPDKAVELKALYTNKIVLSREPASNS